jgi:hypothetical protein
MKSSIDKLGEAAEISQKQFLISARQTDIVEKQHAIGRMQFISTHRPLLRVRYFRRIDISDLKVRINFTIINVGSSQANLLGSYGRLGFFARDNLPPPFYEGAPQVIEPRKFEPGATDEGMILHTRDPNVASILHVYGILVYEDIFNNTRTTAFCRRYNVSTLGALVFVFIVGILDQIEALSVNRARTARHLIYTTTSVYVGFRPRRCARTAVALATYYLIPGFSTSNQGGDPRWSGVPVRC